MTGLIPAAAQKYEIPCIFSVQKFDTARCLLSYVEDIGIDAGGVWQSLYYDRYPGSYEQTRNSNSLDLLLSGILAASHVNTASQVLLPNIADGRSDFMYSPLGKLLVQKWKAGRAFNTPGPELIGFNLAGNKKPFSSYRLQDHHAGNQKNDHSKRQSIRSSENRTLVKFYIDWYETILQRPLVTMESKKGGAINKLNRAKTSGVQASPFPKTDRTKSHPLPNEWISTPAMAPI
jgi:starch synthase/alpha-amylase